MKKGFTLVELLIVIAIIAILAAILFPVFQKAALKSRLDQAASGTQAVTEEDARLMRECYPSLMSKYGYLLERPQPTAGGPVPVGGPTPVIVPPEGPPTKTVTLGIRLSDGTTLSYDLDIPENVRITGVDLPVEGG